MLQFPDDWCCTTDFTYLSHTAVVIPCESARPCRTGERGTRAPPPPQKWGGHVTPNSGTELHTAYSAPRGSLSSSFIPAGRLGTAPPEGVLTERVRYPFPSRCMIPDRSSPSRVRFAASRPGPLRADPRDVLFTREKGGSGRGLPGRKEPVGHTSALSCPLCGGYLWKGEMMMGGPGVTRSRRG